MNQANQELDTRGLNCPLPIVKTRKILNELEICGRCVLKPMSN